MRFREALGVTLIKRSVIFSEIIRPGKGKSSPHNDFCVTALEIRIACMEQGQDHILQMVQNSATTYHKDGTGINV